MVKVGIQPTHFDAILTTSTFLKLIHANT